MRSPQPFLLAAFAGGVLVCAACGGGGGSSGGPPPNRPTPTPTPLPTFTQGPTPPPICVATQNPVTLPMAVGTPLSFPNVAGYCGTITFPVGSTPVGGNSVTLSTAITYPGGSYPSAIPPGPGNYAVGATPVPPWLTYSVKETLFTNGQNPGLGFRFPGGPPPPGFFYYVGVFDLTASPTQPLATFPYSFTPSVRRRVLRVHPNDVTAGHTYYFGLFAQQDGSNVQQAQPSVNPAGGAFTLPPAVGFSGSVPYGANGAASGTTVQLTSSNVDFTGGFIPPLGLPPSQNTCPAPGSGVPIFYEGFLLNTTASQLNFASTSAMGSLSSTQIVSGATYDVCWYDITSAPSSPAVLLKHSGPITALNQTLQFPTEFSAFTFLAGQNIVAEFVKD